MSLQAELDPPTGHWASAEEARLVTALRRGDEGAFAELVDRYHASLVRLATVYVRDRTVAEEVAQETWLGVVQGIDRFQGRSSLKTWIFRILTNTAKTRGEREGRTIPFAALGTAGEDEPAVDPNRFLDASHPVWPGHWASPPASWDEIPERRLASEETLAEIRSAIAGLPALQAQVITLRDVEGWSSEEVCQLLALSEVNQRVLLHRARSKVRRVLEGYLER
ncbi:MAG TPA: sigma-70 family RNA polymerase sigma factor [Gaiellaceae bacterium]|nr:sigma-70 family RNA polymerase sigma factor [Gaiellaceae bacterium]